MLTQMLRVRAAGRWTGLARSDSSSKVFPKQFPEKVEGVSSKEALYLKKIAAEVERG